MNKIVLILFFSFMHLLALSENKKDTIELTKIEKNFIKEHNKLKAITTVTWIPFHYESKDNDIVGLSVEYVNLIAKKTGLNIVIEKANTFTDVLNNIQNKKSDITISTTYTKKRAEYAVFSEPYESFLIAIAVSKGTKFIHNTSFLEGKKVAVGKNYSAYKLLQEKYPLIDFVLVNNTDEAIALVDKKEVFAAVDILPVLQHSILVNSHFDGVKIGGITNINFQLQIMIRKGLDPLVSIINKAIKNINSQDRNEIYKGWITGKEIYRFDYELLYKLIFAFLVIIVIIVIWNNKLRNEIEKRKEAELIIIKEKEKLSNILSLIPVPILITDIETKEIIFGNKYSKKQYSIPEDEEIIGRKIDSLYISSSQRKDIQKAMDENHCLNEFETQYKLQNGNVIDALLSTIPIYYNDKKGVLGIISDITNIKSVQKELENEKNIANAATKSMSSFLANMSHEIRTPLNAILGFIDILKENTVSIENMKYLDIIDKSSHSLLGVINDILDFSKIQHGKVELVNRDFDPKIEFQNIAYLFDAIAKEKKINFELTFKDLPDAINSDILRIKQIILNLLSNAMKFTEPNNSVVFNILYEKESLTFKVEDEGIGIEEDKLESIFNSFTQEDSSTTRKFGGTGLGLAISKELVELLGGELKVNSIKGKGSVFYFCIPVTITEIIKDKIYPTKIKIFSKEKVLLVEDNKVNQMFMEVVLTNMNLQFDIANDGLEAIEMYKKNNYDIILMDENMPNMNGIESTKHILEYEMNNNLQHTPIIALTANAIKGDREKFLEAGMDCYLTKPVNKIELNSLIEEFLDE